MKDNPRNSGALIGGALLVLFGVLALVSQLFSGFDFWGTFWPFIIIGVGAMFFVGMLAGGRAVSGLAIPGSIISVIGLMLFYQNLTGHWESWSYGWTVILMAVGLGIFIMGAWGRSEEQRRSGLKILRIGAIMLIIFGAFFEMIFHSYAFSGYVFPVALIGLGLYLIIKRAGLLSNRKSDDRSDEIKTL